MIWAVAGGKGAPGATTLTALLARFWPVPDQGRVIIEADPEGGVLAARWHASAGLTHDPGLLSLAAARDGSAVERLHRHAQPVSDGVELVAAPPSAAQAEACLRALGAAAAGALAEADVACLVDCGRLTPSSPALPWAQRAERVLLVARPRLEEVVALGPLAERLQAAGVGVHLVCVGQRPFHPLEVAEVAGHPAGWCRRRRPGGRGHGGPIGARWSRARAVAPGPFRGRAGLLADRPGPAEPVEGGVESAAASDDVGRRRRCRAADERRGCSSSGG